MGSSRAAYYFALKKGGVQVSDIAVWEHPGGVASDTASTPAPCSSVSQKQQRMAQVFGTLDLEEDPGSYR